MVSYLYRENEYKGSTHVLRSELAGCDMHTEPQFSALCEQGNALGTNNLQNTQKSGKKWEILNHVGTQCALIRNHN